jgi:hypothetical protein
MPELLCKFLKKLHKSQIYNVEMGYGLGITIFFFKVFLFRYALSAG